MMEAFEGQTYESIMGIPSTRRYRLITKKVELERQRKARMESKRR